MKDKSLKSSDKRRPVPIPPLSVVRVAHHGETKFIRRHAGRIYRIGYYSRQDGLDWVWLVDDQAVYEWTVDHETLYRNFDIIHFANDTNWYGRRRPKIPPIRPADRESKRPKK
jgi:hypothetical protein